MSKRGEKKNAIWELCIKIAEDYADERADEQGMDQARSAGLEIADRIVRAREDLKRQHRQVGGMFAQARRLGRLG